MLGYTEQEVARMIDVIYIASDYVKDVKDEQIVKELNQIADLLDGLLVEGRV